MKGESFFHMAAYYVDQAASAVLARVNAVNDAVLTILNNSFVLPQAGDIVAAFAAGVNMSQAQIDTPSFRYVGLPNIGPTNAALTIASPPNVYNLTEQPLKVPRVDVITVNSSNSAGATEHHYAFLWFSWGRRPVPPGPIFRLRATAAITAVTTVWANGAMTLTQNLPQGQYAIVGMRVMGTNLLGARLIVPGASWRPGVLGSNLLSSVPHPVFTRGDLGVYAVFENVNLPNLEIIADGACTAQTIDLDIVRIGDVGSN